MAPYRQSVGWHCVDNQTRSVLLIQTILLGFSHDFWYFLWLHLFSSTWHPRLQEALLHLSRYAVDSGCHATTASHFLLWACWTWKIFRPILLLLGEPTFRSSRLLTLTFCAYITSFFLVKSPFAECISTHSYPDNHEQRKRSQCCWNTALSSVRDDSPAYLPSPSLPQLFVVVEWRNGADK